MVIAEGKTDSAQNIQNFLKIFRERFSKTGGGRRVVQYLIGLWTFF